MVEIAYKMDNILKLSQYALTVTQNAAISTYNLIGSGNGYESDRIATESMRNSLNNLPIKGHVVIGEGERDQAPMLYHGEMLGNGSENIDIAVDPLEGTALHANNMPGSLSVIAFAPNKGFLNAPDIYMEKLAIGLDFSERIIDLDNSPLSNLKNIAKAKNCNISDLLVIILDRPRHVELIARVKEAGARIKLIADGDVMAIVSLTKHFPLADVYMGIGGAPEGVLAAAALQNTGGQICAKLVPYNSDEEKRAHKAGITNFKKQYFLDDLSSDEVIFCATAITQGTFLNAIRYNKSFITHSLLMYNKVISKIETFN